MSSSPRTTALAAMLAGCALWATACGLSQQGLSEDSGDGSTDGATTGPLDATTGDGPSSRDGAAVTDAKGTSDHVGDAGGDGDGGGPPPCTTLDASCLGAIPASWLPVGVPEGGCGADFNPQTLQANPRLADGGCACGACQVTGAFTCTAGVDVSGGDGCGDPTLVTVAPGTCAPASAQHVEGHAPTAGGTAACTAANDAGTGVTTDPVTLCVPTCAADYCAQPSRCIVASGDVACPAGFTLHAKAGSGADPGCAPCGCTVAPPAACQGTVTVYDNGSCADSGTSATYALGTCNQFSTTNNYNSISVHLITPTPTCSPASVTVDTGDASLTGLSTICCR